MTPHRIVHCLVVQAAALALYAGAYDAPSSWRGALAALACLSFAAALLVSRLAWSQPFISGNTASRKPHPPFHLGQRPERSPQSLAGGEARQRLARTEFQPAPGAP